MVMEGRRSRSVDGLLVTFRAVSYSHAQITHARKNWALLQDFELASHWPGSGPNVGDDLFLVLNILEHLLGVVAVHPLFAAVVIIV